MGNRLHEIQKEEIAKIKNKLPKFNIGDTISVYVKVVEGSKTRTQAFQGTVIAMKGKGLGRTFTVRKISFDVGVERVFPLYSPKISKIEVKKKGDVRRAKLYYLRDKIGKATKVKSKLVTKKDLLMTSEPEETTKQEEKPSEKAENEK